MKFKPSKRPKGAPNWEWLIKNQPIEFFWLRRFSEVWRPYLLNRRKGGARFKVFGLSAYRKRGEP